MRLLLLYLVLLTTVGVNGQVVISEIADKGSSNVCDANDWLELHNAGSEAVDLSGFILHDDNGPLDESAYTFPPDSQLLPDEYLLLCTQQDGGPQFKIGGDDSISLVSTNNQVVSSVGPLPDTNSAFDITYAWNSTDESYLYTTTPTPGAANILRPIVKETPDQIKERLATQNNLGTRFFGIDGRGFPISDALDDVLDLFITMDEADYDYLLKNQSYEVYKPFQSVRIVTKDNEELQLLTSPGRIRPKGQSTLYFGTCLGSPTIPFQLEFNTVNATQTLFGIERAYLRNHLGDNSYMRDWSSHRMLARFGLPHLRARKVRFYINGEKTGFYTLLEAPDQDYVFARSFPNYDPSNYALFKVKSLSIGCGSYTGEQLQTAQQRVNETTTPPYAFERGEHRKKIQVLGLAAFEKCLSGFYEHLVTVELADVVLAYVRSNNECGAMLVKEGLIDRDLGFKNWESTMTTFIDENLASNVCYPGCTNSKLVSEVDVDQFLKNFAVYSVTMNQDSPMGNGNNYYIAETGEGTGWKIVPYDHNTAGDATCNAEECNPKLVYWSVVRPTCASLESNQLVGPLLTDPMLHAQYIEYVRSFTDSVLGNASFIEEMTQHVAAIQSDVAEDWWSTGGVFFDNELSPDASEWNIPQLPLLPLLKAREAEVQAQLQAIDEGTFPRGPHLAEPVEPWETCVDWRSEEPPASPCYEGCRYEGCFMSDWTIQGFCDADTSLCYHGDYDEQCRGIPDVERYDGMENRDDGRETFCISAAGTPTKTSECPSPSNITSAAYKQSMVLLLLSLVLVLLSSVAL